MNLIFHAVAGQFPEAMREAQKQMATGATGALREIGAQVLREGRSNIAGAGLSKRWQSGFSVRYEPKTGVSLDTVVKVRHRISFVGIFEHGGTITGRPLLWIPMSHAPKKIGGRRLTVRLYREQIGPLFKINRPGRPPLLAATVVGAPKTGRRATVAQLKAGTRRAEARRSGGGGKGRGRMTAVPLFVGVPQVKIRKRLNITGVYDKAMGRLAEAYLRHLRDAA